MRLRFIVTFERTGLMLITKKFYRSWFVRYSEGLQCVENGKWKNLWCKPKLERCVVKQ